MSGRWPVSLGSHHLRLADLPAIKVIVYEPTRAYQNESKTTGVEKLTPARALIAEMIRRYETLGLDCSILEVQKLAWVLELVITRFGIKDPLKLKRDRGRPTQAETVQRWPPRSRSGPGRNVPMNEAETRAEYIEPAFAAAGWGVVEGSRIRREYAITLGRRQGFGRRAKPLKADYVLIYRNTKLAVIEAKAWDEELTEGVAQAKDYAEKLAIRFTYSTNGQGKQQQTTNRRNLRPGIVRW